MTAAMVKARERAEMLVAHAEHYEPSAVYWARMYLAALAEPRS